MITTLVTTQNYFFKNKLDALLHVNEPEKKTYHKKLPFYVGEISQLGEKRFTRKLSLGFSVAINSEKTAKHSHHIFIFTIHL
jgi:hypothetical protein